MFVSNQNVIATFNAKIVTVHATPPTITLLPPNPCIPIVQLYPYVSSGRRPLIIGGNGTDRCAITLAGLGADGKLYDISSIAFATPPQVVQWTDGPPVPPNLTPAQLLQWIANNILSLSFTTQPNAPGKLIGMTFGEIAPTQTIVPASGIQVSTVVVLNDGSNQFSFNDSLATAAPGTVNPPLLATYDITLIMPSDPPNTVRLLNVSEASLSVVA